MVRYPAMMIRLVVPLALVACGGGGGKKAPAKPKGSLSKKTKAPAETEESREKKRHAAALAIVPEGSSCLPAALKEAGAPRLELTANGGEAVVCAIDTDRERLLGPVGCWKVKLDDGTLAYQAPTPIPGRGISVKLDDRCARGFCLPKDAKVPGDKIAHMAWNADGSKVAVLAGDDVHLFDAGTKAHESSFSIRGGDKGVSNDPTAVHWVGDAIFVEGADQGPYSAVWMFKADGTPQGPMQAIGAKDDKPMSTHGGSFSLLDKNRVAVSEQGFSTMTIYEVDTSKRSKLVRKLTKPPCKNDELDAYWHDNTEALTPKCKEHMEKNFEHLVGATAVAGSKNFLVLLRGPRLGELAVLDAKTLAEKKVIKLPWCGAGGDAAPAAKE